MKKNKKAIIGLCVVVSYFIFSYCQLLPLKLLGVDYTKMSLTSRVIYLLVTELIYLLILFWVYRKRFIEDFKDFKSNFKPYTRKYMEYWALSFALMLISNFIIVSLFPNSIATNQEIVNNTIMIAPIYMIIASVFFAPFLEETIFRLAFRQIFKNDILFIIMSGLIFGGLHVISSYTNPINLIYIIPYSIPGFIFAYTLVRSKNIFVPMGLHFFHNAIMITVQIVLLFI